MKLQRADILLQARQAPRAGMGTTCGLARPTPPTLQPFASASSQSVDGGQVVLQGTGLEARQDRAEVRAFEVGGAAIGFGQQSTGGLRPWLPVPARRLPVPDKSSTQNALVPPTRRDFFVWLEWYFYIVTELSTACT